MSTSSTGAGLHPLADTKKAPPLVQTQTDPALNARRMNAFAATWSSASSDLASGNYVGALEDVFMGKEARQLVVEAIAIAMGLYIGPKMLDPFLGLTRSTPLWFSTAVYATSGLLLLDASQQFIGARNITKKPSA